MSQSSSSSSTATADTTTEKAEELATTTEKTEEPAPSTTTTEKAKEPAPSPSPASSASSHSESNHVEPITKSSEQTPPVVEKSSETDLSNDVTEVTPSSSSLVSAPAPSHVAMQEKDATTENPEQGSDNVADNIDQVDEAKAKEALDDKPVDNGTNAVISETDSNDVVMLDSNGNFDTDDIKNITKLQSLAHNDENVMDEVSKEVEIAKPLTNNDESVKDEVSEKVEVTKPLTNGDVITEEDESSVKVVEANPLYKDDQWSPLNTDGKKQYDRDFLISLQTNPLSMQKPGTLPANMEVILNAPNLDTIRSVTSAPNLKMFDSQQPFRSSASHQRGTPR